MNVTLGAYTLHCPNHRLAGRRGRGDNISVRKNIIATLLAWAEVLWTGLTHMDPYLQFSQPKDVGNRPTLALTAKNGQAAFSSPPIRMD